MDGLTASFRVTDIRLDGGEQVWSVVCVASADTNSYIVYLMGDDVSHVITEDRHRIVLQRGQAVMLHAYCGTDPDHEHAQEIFSSALRKVADRINEGDW